MLPGLVDLWFADDFLTVFDCSQFLFMAFPAQLNRITSGLARLVFFGETEDGSGEPGDFLWHV